MLTLEPEDCCASGLDKILEDSGRAPDMLFPHVSPTRSIYIKKKLFLHKECSTMKSKGAVALQILDDSCELNENMFGVNFRSCLSMSE